jgi:predicted nucleic acid-binding Zn ribbon protein
VGDLLNDAARELGLEEQLRWVRAAAAWDRIVAEHAPAAAGGSRPTRLEGDGTLVVEAAAPIVGQELRIRAEELLEAFAAAPGGMRAGRLRSGDPRRSVALRPVRPSRRRPGGRRHAGPPPPS